MQNRDQYQRILGRMQEKRGRIQVILGPRQVGKTTLARQVVKDIGGSSYYVTADDPSTPDGRWLEEQWDLARREIRQAPFQTGILILDEIQKVPRWSDTVKKLWDEDSHESLPLKVMLLGSSPLLVARGLSESLAGRFEILHLPHWSFGEMRRIFGLTLDEYLYFGAYPEVANLLFDLQRWENYIRDSIIEATVNKDIFHMKRVDKPALLRQLFQLSCAYAGQILSYQKMQGQLMDAGNTTTLADYLQLLDGAGLVAGLEKYTRAVVAKKRSSPKLLPLNSALITSLAGIDLHEYLDDHELRGRLVETVVGAHLVNETRGKGISVEYWREGPREVDFVLSRGKNRLLIEVKSGKRGAEPSGFAAFEKAHGKAPTLVVGTGDVSLERFLLTPPEEWLAGEMPEIPYHGFVGMEAFAVRSRFEWDTIPPPEDDTREPALFLHVSIEDPAGRINPMHLHYARSRTYLRGGLVPAKEDREELLLMARNRLGEDYRQLLSEGSTTSKSRPIYLNRLLD